MTATDGAGNSATVKVTYFVLHYFDNFLTDTQTFALGWNIQSSSRCPTQTAMRSPTPATPTVDGVAAVSSDATVLDNSFRWDGSQCTFWLSTTSLAAGAHVLKVYLDDGTVKQATIRLTASPP